MLKSYTQMNTIKKPTGLDTHRLSFKNFKIYQKNTNYSTEEKLVKSMFNKNMPLFIRLLLIV